MGKIGKTSEITGLGKLLLDARDEQKQADFAKKVGISLRTLGEIERTSYVSDASLRKLLNACPSLATSPILSEAFHTKGVHKSFQELIRLANLNLSHEVKSYDLQSLSETEARGFLAEANTTLMASYLQGGNPLVFYNTGVNWLNAAASSEGAGSYEHGVISLNLGYLLVQSDYDANLVQQALIHLESAIEILSKTPVLTPDGWKNLLRAHWLRAVAIKMRGDQDGALRALADALSDKSLISHTDGTGRAPLIRQEVLIRQTKSEFARLELDAKFHEPDSIEVFHTNRRLWEFALNDRNKSAARRFSAQTGEVYRRVRLHIEPIYRIAFLRAKLFQLLLDGRLARAGQLKEELLKKCDALQLYGQKRQVASLWEVSQSMRQGRLRLKVEFTPKK